MADSLIPQHCYYCPMCRHKFASYLCLLSFIWVDDVLSRPDWCLLPIWREVYEVSEVKT